jgi:hypothetical protein
VIPSETVAAIAAGVASAMIYLIARFFKKDEFDMGSAKNGHSQLDHIQRTIERVEQKLDRHLEWHAEK